nr:hypothetical protein [Bradyrhizobium diazoefficiens]
MKRVHQTDRKGRTRSKPRPGRQIAIVMDLEAFPDVFELQRRSHGGMLDLVDAGDVLDHGVHDAMLVLEKRRKSTAGNVAEFVDCRGQHRPAVLADPSRIIRAAAEEGDSIRRPGNDHGVDLV